MAVNRNSYGYSSPDVINERAEAPSARTYGGGGVVLGGNLVGEDTPDRFAGLTSMKPIAGKSGIPTNYNNSPVANNRALNDAAAAARRSGSVFMPKRTGR